MAKMFYTLEETAEKLGLDEEQIKQMSKDGKLQQFRDRDKLMFKVDHVDAMVANSKTAGGTGGATSTSIPLVDTGDTAAIDLSISDTGGSGTEIGSGTGLNVFETGEVDSADPMAQTKVTSAADEEELALESVGSGSGLLDLTRESDDTSLGAELFDEIMPTGAGATGTGTGMGSGIGSSGVFESAMGADMTATGLDAAAISSPEEAMMVGAIGDTYDGAGSGLSAGMLLGACACLILALTIAVPAATGVPAALTDTMAKSNSSVWMWLGIMLGGCIIFGVIGMMIGKSSQR